MDLTKQDKIKILKEYMQFPARVAYYLAKDYEEGRYTIYMSPVEDKSKQLRNFKFRELEIVVLGSATAPLGVHDVPDAESVIELSEHYAQVWGILEVEDPELLVAEMPTKD